ncbi:MAG: lipid-A-disaccharide synthase [Roseimicrobium sp.]
MKKLFFLSGEVSGDAHAAGVMRALLERVPSLEFVGFGGPHMKQVGGSKILDWVEQAGVLGLWEVLKMYGWFKQKMDEAIEVVALEKPDAVVLVDYPGFNLRLAKALRDNGCDLPLIYYISPQVWAWKKGRIKTMAKVLNLMICIFPFEKELYERSGLRTVFAGHPMVDRVKTLTRGWTREPGLVGFFPGSRVNEVRKLFPVMLQSAKLILQAMPTARFAVSAANQTLARLILEMVNASDMPDARRWIETGSAYDLMQRAEVGVVASGTATLEAACFGLPYALVYKVNPLTYAVGKAVVRIKHIGIVNILAGETVVKELVQGRFTADKVASEMLLLLQDEAARTAVTTRLGEVVALLREGGAYERAAEAMVAAIESPAQAQA